jgi:hypothetical protein
MVVANVGNALYYYGVKGCSEEIREKKKKEKLVERLRIIVLPISDVLPERTDYCQ